MRRKTSKYPLLAFLLTFLVVGTWGSVPEVRLQEELNRLVSSAGIPGVTLAVILPDERMISLSAGYADMDARQKMKPDDRMFSGSIGKTYVMAVLMQLVAEGKLGLDDPLSRFFPDADWLDRLPNGRSITLRMLLNHTAGVPEYVAKETLWADVKNNPDKIWTGVERLAYILDDKPMNEAGEGFAYADSHYILLGMVIEKITGKGFYSELQQRILDPQNLTNTLPADRRILPGLIPGYSKLGAPFFYNGKVMDEEGRYAFNPQLEWTGGGLISNAPELAKWVRVLYSAKVFSQSLLDEVLQRVKTDLGYEYGLGVIVWKSELGPAYGHSGFVPGYNSIMVYLPACGISAAMQFNCDYVSSALKEDRFACIERFLRIVVSAEQETKR